MDKNQELGQMLKKFRKTTRDLRNKGKRLSQEHFAKELGQYTGMIYTYGTISGWERGKISIPNERILLLGIVYVLHKFGGIERLDEANGWLRAGGYKQLSETEIKEIDEAWLASSFSSLGSYVSPPEHFVGREEILSRLLLALRPTAQKTIIAIVCRGGGGKTAVAQNCLPKSSKMISSLLIIFFGWISICLKGCLWIKSKRVFCANWQSFFMRRGWGNRPLKSPSKFMLI